MILVTGSKGMVGSYVQSVFSGASLHLTDHQTLDITDYERVKAVFEEVKPSVVLHLAAATDVDRCERDADWAFKTNVIGTQNIVFACQKRDILLVYISTGGLFDGNKVEPYNEFDTPAPINAYSKSKWEGEKIIQSFLRRYFIFRAGWMIGGKEKDKKFVSKIIQLCRTRDAIDVVHDKIGSLTFAKDLLQTIHRMIQTPFYGLYHVANQGFCSRCDVAMEIVRLLKSGIRVHPVTSAFFPLPAPRPRSEAIYNYKLGLIGMDEMQSWKDALAEYLKEWKE